MKKEKKKQENSEKKPYKDYVKYSGIAFQLLAIILIGVFGGIKLDDWLNLDFPLFTVALTLLAVGGGLYWLIRGLL